MDKNTHRGTTLPEIIIAMGIFMLIFSLCAGIFSSSWRRFGVTTVVQDTQRNALSGMSRFGRDFSETSMWQVSNQSRSRYRCIYFPSRRDKYGMFDYSGVDSGTWKSWIFYYLVEQTGKTTTDGRPLYLLARKVKEMTTAPLLADLPSYITMKEAQVAARNVTMFTLDIQHTGEVDSYKVVIETQGQYLGKKCSFRTERIFLLNSL